MSDDERLAFVALSALTEGCYPSLTALVMREGPVDVWRMLRKRETPLGDRACQIHPEDLLARAERCGARFISPTDSAWPQQLAALADVEIGGQGGVPLGLWMKGPLSMQELTSSVAVVGSRAATRYGEQVAHEFAAGMAQFGRSVISGGAYGIDAAAHRGAIAGGGRTIAVVASGVDVSYPPGNRALLDVIARDHLVISELPPGTHPTKSRFLARNRLIAALSQGTVLVEAAARSGAKNTVNWSQRCHRTVLAVPGAVTSPLSDTCHALIRDQEALLVGSSAEIHAALSPVGQAMLFDAEGPRRRFDDLTQEQKRIYELIPGSGEITTGDLCLETGFDYPRTQLILSALIETGLVLEHGAGQYRLGERRSDVVSRGRRKVRVSGNSNVGEHTSPTA